MCMEGSFNISNNEKTSYYANSAIGIAGGYSAFRYLPHVIKKPYISYVLNNSKKITQYENNMYWDSALQAFRDSKDYNPGVKIITVDRTNWRTVANEINQRKNADIAMKKERSRLKGFLAKTLAISDEMVMQKTKIIAQGKNASFIPFMSQILVNKNKMGITTFHEIGHSINRNSKGIKKFFAKNRYLSNIAFPVILGIGLLTPKREEGNEFQNPIGKTASFIKEHCGILAGLSMLPIIIEEGIASINGAKLAKTVLDKIMYKKLNKYNTIAFGSYVFGAATLGICTALAVYIKDKVSGISPAKRKD